MDFPTEYPVHTACRRTYCKPSTIASKRKRLGESADRDSKHLCRSQTPVFNFKKDCFYCGKDIFYNGTQKHKKFRNTQLPQDRRDSHQAETKHLIGSALRHARNRDDDWGKEVFI